MDSLLWRLFLILGLLYESPLEGDETCLLGVTLVSLLVHHSKTQLVSVYPSGQIIS